MADDKAGKRSPTTPFASRAEARPPQRRHRFLTLPSGWLLVVCLFLPAWQGCGLKHALPLVVLPPCIALAVGGILIALISAKRTRAELASGAGQLLIFVRAIGALTALAAIKAIQKSDGGIPAILALVAGALIALGLPARGSERTGAIIAVVLSTTSVLVFGACALDRDAVWGAYVAATVACVLFIGTLWWLVETCIDR